MGLISLHGVIGPRAGGSRFPVQAPVYPCPYPPLVVRGAEEVALLSHILGGSSCPSSVESVGLRGIHISAVLGISGPACDQDDFRK
jgi:hypothetical protein